LEAVKKSCKSWKNLPYSLHFGVCDAKLAPRIASTATNKLCWKSYPDKIHYWSI